MTKACAFHLNNKEAERKLQIIFKGEELRHNFKLKYLGITLDRSPDTFFVGDLLELHTAESDRSIQFLRNLTVNL